MFDFDDIEEAATARLEAGEDDEVARAALGAAAEPPAPWRGGLLPPMRNIAGGLTPHLPSIQDLPGYLPAMNLEPRLVAGCRVRLLVFYGAGDSVPAWVNFMLSVPEWLDVAVYESPGHGQRKAEPIPDTLADVSRDAFQAVSAVLLEHARGGRLEGAPFALAGHSMGTQVMVEVAVQLKRKLGLEPACMFAIDRGAPHVRLYTDEGYRLLCMDEPQEFFDGFNPHIGRLMQAPARQKPGTDVERQIRMWQKDLRISQEHIWEIGRHIFHCDIHVLRAMYNFLLDKASRDGTSMEPAVRRQYEICCRVTASGPDCSAPFSLESYEEWRRWTAELCKVHDIPADHVGIKLHADTMQLVVSVLGRAAGVTE